MSYSEHHFERMKTDPDLRRKYFWRVAFGAQYKAGVARARGNKDEADRLDRFASFIFEHIETFVETTDESPSDASGGV